MEEALKIDTSIFRQHACVSVLCSLWSISHDACEHFCAASAKHMVHQLVHSRTFIVTAALSYAPLWMITCTIQIVCTLVCMHVCMYVCMYVAQQVMFVTRAPVSVEPNLIIEWI